jgi:uncharacterized protein with GYD domain
MHTYFMLGRYTSDSIRNVSPERTRLAISTIEEFNGQIMGLYALLGEFDIVFIVNLPGNREAMDASVRLFQRTGIMFRTLPAINAERFDASLEKALEAMWPAAEDAGGAP